MVTVDLDFFLKSALNKGPQMLQLLSSASSEGRGERMAK